MQDKPRDIAQLEALIGDPGWLQVKDRNEKIIRYWEKLLLVPSAQRKDTYPDDFLRGRIDALRSATDWPAAMVSQFYENNEDAVSEEAVMAELANEHRARLGYKFPLTFNES